MNSDEVRALARALWERCSIDDVPDLARALNSKDEKGLRKILGKELASRLLAAVAQPDRATDL